MNQGGGLVAAGGPVRPMGQPAAQHFGGFAGQPELHPMQMVSFELVLRLFW